jgi:hypothetical protein
VPYERPHRSLRQLIWMDDGGEATKNYEVLVRTSQVAALSQTNTKMFLDALSQFALPSNVVVFAGPAASQNWLRV